MQRIFLFLFLLLSIVFEVQAAPGKHDVKPAKKKPWHGKKIYDSAKDMPANNVNGVKEKIECNKDGKVPAGFTHCWRYPTKICPVKKGKKAPYNCKKGNKKVGSNCQCPKGWTAYAETAGPPPKKPYTGPIFSAKGSGGSKGKVKSFLKGLGRL